jgi:hypothetical protein
MKNLVKPGSPMLYFLTRGLNLLFGLSGAALIALTIWLSGRFNQYTYVNGVFLGLGILEVLLCGAIFLVRKSVT